MGIGRNDKITSRLRLEHLGSGDGKCPAKMKKESS